MEVINLSPKEMSNSEENTLRTIAQHKTRSAATALGLLNYLTSKDTTLINENDTSSSANRIYLGYEEDNDAPFSLFSINPNPANESILLSYSLLSDVAELRITDIAGRVASSIKLVQASHSVTIDTKGLNSGIYFCELLDNSVVLDKQKLIIQHH